MKILFIKFMLIDKVYNFWIKLSLSNKKIKDILIEINKKIIQI